MTKAVLCVAALVLGCGGGTRLSSQSDAIDDLIATARDHGAQRCAPVELAMAESHNAFGKQELAEGNYYQARGELMIAEKNVHEAIRRSPKDKCAPKKRVAKGPEAPVDTDGDGILDPDDECPLEPEDMDGFQDEDGCPDLDNDNDGLADKIDDCPNEPEDKDGFQDEDGCPDLDNDADGLADKIDQCPDQAEDVDGFEDEDGCPDLDNDGDGVPDAVDKCPDEYAETTDGCPKKYKLVVVTKTKIEIKQTIYFQSGKAKIKPVSFPLLNEVGQALVDNPSIKVRIEGHTDSRGSDSFNEKLSDSRAHSVRKYLVGRGVDGDRMVAKGYGEAQPIADNRTDTGRAQNRRVEFVIIER
ncbi:MAG TPA: OmpA family protein [Kofleriaceae bacterium]|nr:OmpA family protein [Kofleriaceae bacterium]